MRRHLKPQLNRPIDFDEFWEATFKELQQIPANAVRDPEDTDLKGLKLSGLRFSSLGEASIGAYLLEWSDTKARPLVVHSHGYGSVCNVDLSWAQAGVNVLGVDIRGCGRSQSALNPSAHGYILTGIESTNHYVLRGAVCDYIRAAQIGQELLGDRISKLVFKGISFAGALAVMAQSVSQLADLLTVGVPTFGWVEGRHFFVKRGSGHEINEYLEDRPENTDDLLAVLRYFDVINHAARVRCPALIGLGLKDDVVPAETVFAIANHFGGAKQIMEFPVSHSNSPEQKMWEQFDKRGLSLALGQATL